MRTVTGVSALALVAVFAAACSGGAASPSASAAASEAASESAAASEAPSQVAIGCTPDTLATKTAGTLTIGADNPGLPAVLPAVRPEPRSVGAR